MDANVIAKLLAPPLYGAAAVMGGLLIVGVVGPLLALYWVLQLYIAQYELLTGTTTGATE